MGWLNDFVDDVVDIIEEGEFNFYSFWDKIELTIPARISSKSEIPILKQHFDELIKSEPIDQKNFSDVGDMISQKMPEGVSFRATYSKEKGEVFITTLKE